MKPIDWIPIYLLITLAAIIALCIWIYHNTGERGAAKRAERDYRYRKYYEIKDEVDEIERELTKVNTEVERQYKAQKAKTDHTT